ncbi:head-proximal tip of tail protein [Synechococcus phage ACG-2014i]|jgi:4-hydroxyphenylpyruvate dioxygenase-like putative hemolysin|uniref:Head-proximal tip of tail protein n=1 Tax=Synechococcus phage ACG-2014i TaxID=1493513 RepID=A0A0E3HJ94_9CAUD|nr:head-proximal tip of tail protein [Synechococcus phage ACG-2014i]AIX26832.1 head-proximal tip of tail protein [Synechococcus phage ACG-2014i]
MSANWYKEQPTNRNFLNPIGYLLKLEKFEGVDFFCQRANVPDITMPTTEVVSPFRNLPIVPSGGVAFGDFSVSFIVDEDLKNYNSIHKWIRDNGNADQMQRTTKESDIYTNAQLHIVTSQYNPAFVVEFRNIFPVSLSGLQFDATITDVEYITAEITFKHQQFFIRDKNLQPL